MFHCSAAEGQKFQEEATRISKLIEDLGNNPIKEDIKKTKKPKTSKKPE
jgi:hypothetical protein